MAGEPGTGAPGDAILGFLGDYFTKNRLKDQAREAALTITNETQLEELRARLPPEVLEDPAVKVAFEGARSSIASHAEGWDPVRDFITGCMSKWIEVTGGTLTPEAREAIEGLSTITEGVLGIAAAATAIDLALGAIPTTTEGVVSSNATRQVLTWLGVGAVLSAVCHDPVKIGVLRPYQDKLEAAFRNRRPDDMALFQAYRTRELSPTKVEDLALLDDKMMDAIEVENQTIYDTEIAKWGYSEWFAKALSRSATYTLTFSQLVTLARAGIWDRGLAIYSLWGIGLDRVCMRAALDALERLFMQAQYEGFRSLIEPSFTQGFITEEDLKDYYDKCNIPEAVQVWVLPRLRAQREKTLASGGTVAKLKRLPLTDYEKAFKNNIRTKDEVLERITGEYDPRDIALESDLLDIGKE